MLKLLMRAGCQQRKSICFVPSKTFLLIWLSHSLKSEEFVRPSLQRALKEIYILLKLLKILQYLIVDDEAAQVLEKRHKYFKAK